MTDSADVVRRRAAPISPERWSVLEPLVDHALELPPAERAPYIAELRQRDAVIGAEVELFVADCERPDPRFSSSAPARFGYLLDDQAPAPIPADTVLADRYQIEQEIGRGGMAIVYRAADLKLDRRPVAVKVMRRGRITSNAARRFLEEIRLTGMLGHPNIVPVYDAGDVDEHAFFVMPHVEGETLRARLAREDPPRLPIPEALKIGIEVARALEYAHAHGVIHRDVKPSNLLLTSGVAMLADFGIARAEGVGEPLTDVGVRLGTPAYMSPEQCDAGDDVDSRTDIYSLGCVLYEMIAGVIPCNAQKRGIESRIGTDPVRPLRELRADVSPRLEACVAAAMAVEKNDRIGTAAEVARELESCARDYGVSVAGWKRLYWRAPRRVAIAAGIVAIGVVGGSYRVVRQRAVGREAVTAAAPLVLAGESMDTSRIVILPFERANGAPAMTDAEDRLRDAFRRWDGVDAVDRLETREALSHRDSTAPLTATAARDVGRAVKASRYVSVEVRRDSDATVIRAGIYDARTGAALASQSTRPATRRSRTDAVFDSLADRLLFPDVAESTVVALRAATHSRPALQAYAKAQVAIAAWDLERADTALATATNYDQRFSLAYLWLAQVRSWREMAPGTWQFAAHRAAAGRAALAPRDRRVADALTATAALDSARACDIWRGLTSQPGSGSDFAAWYGVARCEFHDRTVVRDARSVSGWSFRTSYQHATNAYRRAFQILPGIHREFRHAWYSTLKQTLRTQRTQLRFGTAQRPDTGHFAAYPSWSAAGDSLAFIPYPLRAFEEGRPEVVPATSRQAAEHQREVFLDIATTWRAAFRPSADALLAVAVALDEQGDSTAVDSVHLARRLADEAGDASARLMTGSAEVWMLVKGALPNGQRRLETARLLADSLLRGAGDRVTDSTHALALASLAALTGHVHLAARFARSSSELVLAPIPLRSTVRAFQSFAALGAPVDSIRALATYLWTAPAPAARPGDRPRWMRRAATISFPVYHDSAVRDLARGGDFLAVVESAWLDRDTATIRTRFSGLREARGVTAPEELKLEALYPEAWVLASAGDPAAALAWLTPTLDAQARSSTEALRSVVGAAALVHAMALRAQLADRLGRNAEAASWARAVIALWSDADDELRPVVKEMKRLSR
jgi:tRNA A-37 threonylcarbamoyl transferase component Bud32